MKKCCTCKAYKPLESFHNNRKRPDGKASVCKACKKIESAGYWKERVKATTQKWRRENPGKAKEQHRKYNRKFGMNFYERQEFRDRHGKCAICPSTEKLSIDHDHKTGKLRGVLCRKCNLALGLFGDSPELILRAAFYLRNSSRIAQNPSSEVLEAAP
jgi:hypothetical protein